MTTITAVNKFEVIVNNNGRAVRVSVDKLMAVDEYIAASAVTACRNIGQPVTISSKQPRGTRPRNSVMHAVLQ